MQQFSKCYVRQKASLLGRRPALVYLLCFFLSQMVLQKWFCENRWSKTIAVCPEVGGSWAVQRREWWCEAGYHQPALNSCWKEGLSLGFPRPCQIKPWPSSEGDSSTSLGHLFLSSPCGQLNTVVFSYSSGICSEATLVVCMIFGMLFAAVMGDRSKFFKQLAIWEECIL